MTAGKGEALTLVFSLDHKVNFAVADLLVGLLVEEMEFGPVNEKTKRREKDGWGIGTRLVTRVMRVPRPQWVEPAAEIAVKFIFNGEITKGQAEVFTNLVSAEVSGSAWGIGQARVLRVGELEFGK